MPERFITANDFVESVKIKQITNPYSNEVIGEVYIAEEKDFNRSAAYLKETAKKYQSLPVYKKYELVKSVHQTKISAKKSLASSITLETGKPIRFSLIELERAELTFRLGMEECSRLE